MKNVPKKIYLQIDADGETPEDFNELVGITWCTEKINPNDIEFILNGEIRESGESICVSEHPCPHKFKGNKCNNSYNCMYQQID